MQTTARPGSARGRIARRRSLAALLSAVLTGIVAVAPVAAAATPAEVVETTVSVQECAAVSGPLSVSLTVAWADFREPDPDLTISGPDGPLAYSQHPEAGGAVVEYADGVLSGRTVLLGAVDEGDGGPSVVGTATFALPLNPSGEPTSTADHWSEGNTTIREAVTTQPLSVAEGTLQAVLGDAAPAQFDLSGCPGSRKTRTLVSTQPDTSVERLPESLSGECHVTNEQGDELLLQVETHGDALEAWVVVAQASGGVLSGFGDVTWTGTPRPITGDVPLVRYTELGEEPAGAARVELTTSKVGQTRYDMVFQDGRNRTATTFLSVAGDVALPDGSRFDVPSCEATLMQALKRRSDPTDGHAQTPAPTNDSPSSAAALPLGQPGTNTHTAGAARDAEVPMSCLDDPFGDGSLLPGHTVWYRIDGTGGTVTVDPAGSKFNTVIAAYELSAAGLAETGCADDIVGDPRRATTLAPLSFETEAGKTYLVQAGGFGHQHGLLRIAAR